MQVTHERLTDGTFKVQVNGHSCGVSYHFDFVSSDVVHHIDMEWIGNAIVSKVKLCRTPVNPEPYIEAEINAPQDPIVNEVLEGECE